MYKKSYLLPILLGLITVVFVSCDRDYNELGSEIVRDNHFGFTRDTVKTIKAYNQKLGPVASNNLAINPLGFYENPAFGNTQANFVTQVELAVTSPVFNNTDSTLYEKLPEVDSVVVDIPYFVDNTQTILNSDGTRTYVLDSIYGVNESKFKLSVHQSNYYLRNLDPDLSLADTQSYYTDQDADIDNNKTVWLNDSPNVDENSQFYFDKREHALKSKNSKGEDVVTRTAPSMRLHLNKEVFDNLILKAPSGQLANNNTFKNYFRGLYFKTESLGNPGNMAMIDFKAGKITMYYQEDKKTGTGDGATYERVSKTLILNMTGNTISLLNNSPEKLDYLNAINPSQEASRLSLIGGEGAVTVIDLFGSADLYGYKKREANGKPIDENGNVIVLDQNGNPKNGYFVYERTNSRNGVADELDDLRYPIFTKPNEPVFYSKEKKLLINDASLVFYIDRSAMSDPKTNEPQRIYLYDLTNNKVLADYALDGSTNKNLKNNKDIFGGIIELKAEDDGFGKRGSQYKIRITNHIRNLLGNFDLDNVRLGLSVTENINNVGFSKVKTPNSNFDKVPAMSVMNPLGTVLYGSNILEGDTNYGKRLKLEIDYTKPN